MAAPIAEAKIIIGLDKTKLASQLLGVRRMLTSSVKNIGGILRRTMSAMLDWRTLLGGYFLQRWVRAGISQFATFEAEMDKSLAILKGAIGREKELETVARSAAKRFGRSHQEMAQSYFYLASAGLDASRSIAVFNDMATFATAGSFDMAEATDMLTDSLSALGWASEDTETYGRNMRRLGDLIVKGNTLANTSVRQLAEALMNRGATAMSSFNIEVEDGVSALLALADKGYAKGARAGNEFMILIRGLSDAYRSNTQAFKEHGIELYDSQNRFRSLADIVQAFSDNLGKLSAKDMADVLRGQMKLNRQSYAVLLALMGTQDRMRMYRQELEKAGGVMDTVAKRNMGNLLTVWNRFKASVVDLAISLNKVLKPAWEGIVAIMKAMTDAVTEAVEAGGLSSLKDWAEATGESLKKMAEWLDRIRVTNVGEALKKAGGIFIDMLLTGARIFGRVIMEVMTRAADWFAYRMKSSIEEAKTKSPLSPMFGMKIREPQKPTYEKTISQTAAAIAKEEIAKTGKKYEPPPTVGPPKPWRPPVQEASEMFAKHREKLAAQEAASKERLGFMGRLGKEAGGAAGWLSKALGLGQVPAMAAYAKGQANQAFVKSLAGEQAKEQSRLPAFAGLEDFSRSIQESLYTSAEERYQKETATGVNGMVAFLTGEGKKIWEGIKDAVEKKSKDVPIIPDEEEI